MLFLIPLFPLIGFLINASFGRRLSKSISGGLACLAMLASFVVSAASVWSLVQQPPEARAVDQVVFTWFGSGDLSIPLTFHLDPLSALMILVVTGIGFLIHVYSTAYMHEETDADFARYFSYLNLFASFMLVLVLGASLPVLFVGWEGVGLCSYLLIGFYYTKKSAGDAGKKAFIVNRIGDFAFIVAMLLTFATFRSLDIQTVAGKIAALPVEASWGVLSTIALLMFIGATGKSAQIPLYTWLPDAMEGPTPVSALIHAATMVTAGVYMIGRNAELYSHAPQTLIIVAIIGAATALFAGTIGLVQTDIKRVLAYSTVSQLGYMFLAMGVGAYAAGIFHLYTHAFFKALLFLGSGAVIHALAGEQDIRRMGGLKKDLPITYWTFLIGATAIAGVPPLAGFFSKDEILFRTFSGGHTLLWVVGALTSLLTATYMFRLVFLTFHGERAAASAPDDAHGAGHGRAAGHDAGHGHGATGAHGRGGGHGAHLHDAPPAMATALIVLAIGSVVAGFFGVPHALGGSNRIEAFLEPAFHGHPAAGVAAGIREAAAPARPATAAAEPGHEAGAAEGHASEANEGLELTLMGTSTLIAFVGIGLAAYFFLSNRAASAAMARSMAPLHRLLLNKYYVDEIYDAAIVNPTRAVSETALWKGVDAGLIDGLVNGVGGTVRGGGAGMRLLQTGSVRTYAASLIAGVVVAVGYMLWR